MERRSVKIILLVVVLAFTLYADTRLRPYLFHHHVKPEIIANTLPNFLAVLIFSLIFSIIREKQAKGSPLQVSLMATIAMVLYEFAQFWMPERTFDWDDVLVSVVAGIFSYLLLSAIHKFSKNNEMTTSLIQ